MKKPASPQNVKNAPKRPSAQKEMQKTTTKFRWEGWAVFAVAVIFYATSIENHYCLDDVMVILMNSFTIKGIKGFHDILTKDTFYGFIGSNSTLSGGRYRPLSLLTFALEWQFFKGAPNISHFINIMLYAFTGMLLYKFLKEFIFKANHWIAFTATLIFITHPIHTEVIDNIKSRDELLSLLGSLASLYFLLDYIRNKNKVYYLLSALCFFVALFAKENTITYLVVMPLALFLFSNKKLGQIFRLIIPHLALAIVFIAIRASIVPMNTPPDPEILNNPYVKATFAQKYATIFLTLLYYVKLLFIPYPLSYDYSFNEIPYTNFADYRVILSVLLHFGLFMWAIMNLKKRPIPAFSILYYIFTLSITSNLIVNIGAPMGERFLYMPSVGFSILMAYLIWQGIGLLKVKVNTDIIKYTGFLIGGAIILVFAIITFGRNNDWEDDINLYLHDVKVVPHSAPAQMRCAVSCINLADSIQTKHVDTVTKDKHEYYLNEAINHLKNALAIYPGYGDAFINLTVAYINSKQYYLAEGALKRAREIRNDHPKLKELTNTIAHILMDSAMLSGGRGHLDTSLFYLKRAETLIPGSEDLYYNYGGYYFTAKDYAKARENWEKCLAIKPSYAPALNGIKALEHIGK